MSNIKWRAVDCPSCGAWVNSPCRTREGVIAYTTHRSRIKRYREAYPPGTERYNRER